jgi:3',5'-nucleoside bisphosphate phosphatase
VHVLAYGGDPTSPGLAAEMARVRDGRLGRLAGVLAKLAELGVPVSEAEVMAQVGESPSVGRPHIADALIKAGHVRDRQEAFDRFLADGGPAHVHRYTIEVERGIDLVHEAGGLAVIAHPWGRGREFVLPSSALESLFHDQGLDGIEVDHQDHDSETRQRLRTLADGLGLLATGASDYHGIGKLDHDLGCNTTDPEVFNEMQRRLGSR